MKKNSLFRILLASIALVSITSCGGKTGPQGIQGEQGAPGDKGDKGDTGPQGNDGENGKDGTSLLNGHGVPDDSLGHNGDSYVDLDTWDYYTKANDTWTKQGNIKGDKGEDAETPTQEGTIGLDFYPLDDGTVGVRAGKASELSNVVIPSTYMGYTVSTILSKAFNSCSKLKTISIPDTITSIENEAFYNCSSLTSISIPNNVTSIGNSAFSYCSSLTSATLSNNLAFISNRLFWSCSSLTSITIPNSVTSIGDNAFSGCSSLTSITIPDSVTSIGSYAFEYCSSLTSITIPNSVASIGNSVFSGCSFLIIYCEASSKPSGWDYYWNSNHYPVAWGVYGEIKSNSDYHYILINDSVYICKYIGSSAEVTMPSVIDEKSVTSIGSYAFYNCSSLTSIVIPNSVAFIGNYAFYKCSSLTIYCEASSEPSGWDYYWNPDNRPVVWGYSGS